MKIEAWLIIDADKIILTVVVVVGKRQFLFLKQISKNLRFRLDFPV
jgi:hypothetical protein